MYQKTPVTLGPRHFSSKREAKEFIQRLLRYFTKTDRRAVEGQESFDVLLALLKLHPDAKEKIGGGVKSFYIKHNFRTDRKNLSTGFWFERVDGTHENFSYKKCIYPPKTIHALFSEACRTAVNDDINQFKHSRTAGGVAWCDQTADATHYAQLEVDHHPITFASLVDKFLREVFFSKTPQNIGTHFAFKVVIEAFREFHRENATLRLVKTEINQNAKNEYNSIPNTTNRRREFHMANNPREE